MEPRRAGVVFAFLAYASWGLLSPVGKHLLEGYLPMGLNAVRFALATAVVLAAIGAPARHEAVRLLLHPGVFWANLLANASLTMFLYSVLRLPATFATLGFFGAPLWTALLARWTLGEHVGWQFVPAALALVAGAWIALFGLGAPAGADALGMALAAGSGVVWALYSVVLRKAAPGIGLKPLMGASFILGTLYFYALALLLEGPPRILGRESAEWGWMAVYVAVPTLASFVLFNAAMQRAAAGLVNLFVGAELACTALFAWLLFGEDLAAVQFAGLAVVVAAVTGYLWARRTPNPK